MNNEDYVIKKSRENSPPELLPPPVKEKRSNVLMFFLLTVAALCVLGIIVINTISSFAPENYVFNTSSASTFHTSDGNTLIVFRNGNKTNSVIVDNVICSASCNHGYVEEYVNDAFVTLDTYSKVMMCLDADGSKLSVITSKDGETEIASTVKSACMDEAGNKVFYIDSDGNLKVYNVKSAKTSVIDTNSASCVIVSPSGKSLVYEKSDGELFITTNEKNGKKLEINGCYSLISVSDDAKTFYYFEKSDKSLNISVYSNGKSTALLSDIDLNKFSSAFSNSDKTEIILTYDSETYITYNRTSIKKIYVGSLVYPMKPETASREQGIPLVRTYKDTMITGTNSEGNFELLHITRNLTCEYVNGVSNGVRITEDGKYVYGLNTDSLVRVDISNGYKTKTVATSVASFTMSYDGEDIYYVDTDGALWHVYNEKAKKIASACKEFCIDRDGTLFFTGAMGDGETLYYSRFGSSPKKIESIEGVFSLFSFGGYTYFTSYEDDGKISLFAVYRNGYHKITDKIIY